MILSSWALVFTNLGFGPCLIHANDKREWGLMCSPTFAFSIVNLQFSNVQKITSAENLRSRASDEIVPFREFIIKDDTSALL